MVFGRVGSGGVINRVTKQADWDEHREIWAQVGSYGPIRSAVDIGRAINSNAAFRVTAMYEDSDSYRDGVSVERYGINPTASFRLGERTTATVGYEHFRDDRIADRGIPSFRGRPVDTDASTFFGNAALRPTWARVNAFNALVRSEEHTSELQSLMRNSYAGFCLKTKKNTSRARRRPRSY